VTPPPRRYRRRPRARARRPAAGQRDHARVAIGGRSTSSGCVRNRSVISRATNGAAASACGPAAAV